MCSQSGSGSVLSMDVNSQGFEQEDHLKDSDSNPCGMMGWDVRSGVDEMWSDSGWI